jgi:hypothetical protein
MKPRRQPKESDMTDIERAAVDLLIASRRIDAVLNDAAPWMDDHKTAWAEFEEAVAKINEAIADRTASSATRPAVG